MEQPTIRTVVHPSDITFFAPERGRMVIAHGPNRGKGEVGQAHTTSRVPERAARSPVVIDNNSATLNVPHHPRRPCRDGDPVIVPTPYPRLGPWAITAPPGSPGEECWRFRVFVPERGRMVVTHDPNRGTRPTRMANKQAASLQCSEAASFLRKSAKIS